MSVGDHTDEYPAINKVLGILRERLGVTSHEQQSPDCEQTTRYVSKNIAHLAHHMVAINIAMTHKNIQQTFSSKDYHDDRLIILKKVIRKCYDWRLKWDIIRILENHTNSRRKLRERCKLSLSRMVIRDDEDSCSSFLPLGARINCVQRLGKLQLAVLYNHWRLKRFLF